MKIRLVVLGFLCAAGLSGQSKFSWQDHCFRNPASPVCKGNDYAVKPPPRAPARTNETAPRSVITNPVSSAPRTAAPSVIAIGAVDWRFADPFADALIGVNFARLSSSPLVRELIAMVAAKQSLAEADIQKTLDRLSGVDQVAVSVRNNRAVAVITGSVVDSGLPPPDPGMKAAPLLGGAMLIGHADTVDQALQRISNKAPLTDLARLAQQQQSANEFWVMGSAALLGSDALRAGIRRFSLAVSLRERLTSDVALEFIAPPAPKTLQQLRTALGEAAIEGNTVHIRASVEAGEVQRKFAEVAAGPLGPGLASLVQAAQYLPAPDTTVPKWTKPIIYGLEGGPREVNQDVR